MIGADAPDLDTLAQALREDGVVVDRLIGSGEAQDSHDRIAALVRETPFPVYVALTETPVDVPAEDMSEIGDILAGSLHRRLGDGLYVVQTTDSSMRVYSWGLGADPSLLALTAYANNDLIEARVEALTSDHTRTPPVVEAEGQVRSAEELLARGTASEDTDRDYPPSLGEADAEELAERAITLEASADWRPGVEPFVEVRTASTGLSALVGSLAGLIAALLIGQTLWGWPRYGPRRPRAVLPDPVAERAEAVHVADLFAAELAATDWNQVADRDLAHRALGARDAVELLLRSEDVGDLIGAQMVARAGSRDLQRGTSGEGEPLRVCFFDPRHPPATETVSWRLGAGEVDVPCCRGCGGTVAMKQAPKSLLLPDGRQSRPYWERDDVWASTGYGSLTETLAGDVLTSRARRS